MSGPGDTLALPAEADIATLILQMAGARGAQKSICPSEVARHLRPKDGEWQRLMPLVRRVAAGLARSGSLSILRHNKPIDPDAIRGVIRLSLPRLAAAPATGEDEEHPEEAPAA